MKRFSDDGQRAHPFFYGVGLESFPEISMLCDGPECAQQGVGEHHDHEVSLRSLDGTERYFVEPQRKSKPRQNAENGAPLEDYYHTTS